MNIIDFISQSWHWSVSGLMIAFVMFLLIYFGQRFGVSSSFRALCTIGGAKNLASYFDYNWKDQDWMLTFIFGAAIGGGIAINFLGSPAPVQISTATINDLAAIGISTPQTNAEGLGFIPHDLMNFENLTSLKGLITMVLGGFLIGFGTRWAGGCTSGHAISGLSNLQLPSLVAVIGFFIGGLVMTHLLLPIILSL